MKSSIGLFSAALVHLAAGQNTASNSLVFLSDGKPSPTWVAPVPGTTGNFGTAICGQGFTYCGYILRDHQNFREEDIVRVYCASGKDNCANGKTKTDPLQALYVCLPPQSNAISPQQNVQHPIQPHNNKGGGTSHPRRMMMVKGRQAPPAAPAPTSSATGSGLSGDGTCSSTPTVGNQLALLCSCGGQCLNPKDDHIGRCDAPCNP